MKKVILVLLLSFLIIFKVTPTQAVVQKTIRIPTILQGATESIQKVIDTLISKTDNHEARIAELEKKIAALEAKITKLEAKSVINDGNSNAQQSQEIKEGSEVIPLNQSQQDSTNLNQKISDFLSSSSNKIENNQMIGNANIILDSEGLKLK